MFDADPVTEDLAMGSGFIIHEASVSETCELEAGYRGAELDDHVLLSGRGGGGGAGGRIRIPARMADLEIDVMTES